MSKKFLLPVLGVTRRPTRFLILNDAILHLRPQAKAGMFVKNISSKLNKLIFLDIIFYK